MSQTNESCTRFAKLLGIEVPFLNAPMEGIATPELVAAVSEAGGLGVIPAAGLAPDEIRAFAARVKELTQKPFAVNLAVPVDAPADAAERFERFGDAVSMLLEELELPAGPIWETSKTPSLLRTFRCSSLIPVGYSMGILYPANGAIRAPKAS